MNDQDIPFQADEDVIIRAGVKSPPLAPEYTAFVGEQITKLVQQEPPTQKSRQSRKPRPNRSQSYANTRKRRRPDDDIASEPPDKGSQPQLLVATATSRGFVCMEPDAVVEEENYIGLRNNSYEVNIGVYRDGPDGPEIRLTWTSDEVGSHFLNQMVLELADRGELSILTRSSRRQGQRTKSQCRKFGRRVEVSCCASALLGI